MEKETAKESTTCIEPKIPDYLIKLIDSCSNYIKIGTQFWIVMAILSIITLSPDKDTFGKFKLPFSLGLVAEKDFYVFTFITLSLSVICFGSAICQSIRTRLLINRAVDALKKEYIFNGRIHLQDIVDGILYPTINRVAPLAQVLQGKKQLLPESDDILKHHRRFSTVYYYLLKVIVNLALGGLPLYALCICFVHIQNTQETLWHIPNFLFWILAGFSIAVIIQLLILEVWYSMVYWERSNPTRHKKQ